MDKKIEDINLRYNNRDFVAEWLATRPKRNAAEVCKHTYQSFVGYTNFQADMTQLPGELILLPYNDFTQIYVRTNGKLYSGDQEVYACQQCGKAIL